MSQRIIRYGDLDVPVVDRSFWVADVKQPYRKTYKLKPGQHWRDAELTPAQWENYVLLECGDTVPVGAAIARELASEGTDAVVFTEMWSRLVLVGPDLVCVNEQGSIHEMLEAIRARTGGRLGGLPDVIGTFPDGRIVMREAKNIAAKDKLDPKQHDLARIARDVFGDRLDLAVVEWGAPNMA